MPYPTNTSLPAAVKKRVKSPIARRQFRHVFDSSIKAHPGDEARAFAEANAVVNRRRSGVLKAKG